MHVVFLCTKMFCDLERLNEKKEKQKIEKLALLEEILGWYSKWLWTKQVNTTDLKFKIKFLWQSCLDFLSQWKLPMNESLGFHREFLHIIKHYLMPPTFKIIRFSPSMPLQKQHRYDITTQHKTNHSRELENGTRKLKLARYTSMFDFFHGLDATEHVGRRIGTEGWGWMVQSLAGCHPTCRLLPLQSPLLRLSSYGDYCQLTSDLCLIYKS